MSITDELREWFKDHMFKENGWHEIYAIADRIDAEHESACAEAYGNGYADCAAFTHHHAPTVEDVLREFAYGLGVPVANSYVAATAAKLRLAEGED